MSTPTSPQPTSSATWTSCHEERLLAVEIGLAADGAYMADLEDEIAACRAAYVGAAVTEIATMRAELSGAAARVERRPRMSRAVRITNILVVVIPFVAFVAALTTLWNAFVGPLDLAIAFVMYVLTILGVTVGFHRLLTHRAFRPRSRVEYALAILGSMAVEGPVDQLGRRPPQAPRPHRRGGRPALARTATAPACGGARQGPVARARRLAVRDHGVAEREQATRATWSRTAAIADRSTCFVPAGVAVGLAIPFAARLARSAARWHARADRACCGAASCASSCCTT